MYFIYYICVSHHKDSQTRVPPAFPVNSCNRFGTSFLTLRTDLLLGGSNPSTHRYWARPGNETVQNPGLVRVACGSLVPNKKPTLLCVDSFSNLWYVKCPAL